MSRIRKCVPIYLSIVPKFERSCGKPMLMYRQVTSKKRKRSMYKQRKRRRNSMMRISPTLYVGLGVPTDLQRRFCQHANAHPLSIHIMGITMIAEELHEH